MSRWTEADAAALAAAWKLYALECGMCICPELENLSDGPGDSEEKRPSCPVHGAVLYGGEPLANVAELADGKEPECPF